MDTRKRWHRYLILLVVFLTLYNILPTVLYYSKPLRTPIDETRAMHVAENIVHRVNALEGESIEWLQAFAKHLKLKPTSIEIRAENPAIIEIANARVMIVIIERFTLNIACLMVKPNF